MRVRYLACFCLVIAVGACTSRGPATKEKSGSSPAASVVSAEDRRLVLAATEIVGFLQGKVPFDEIETAPSVTLRLAKSGGGASREVPRDSLRDLQNWHVKESGTDYSFLPPKERGELVTRPGKHLNCKEYDLASAVEGSDGLPHVGTMIQPSGSDTCLRKWNVTFVFDPKVGTPTLIWAVYDQWEW